MKKELPIHIKHCEQCEHCGFVLEGMSPMLGQSYEFTVVVNGKSNRIKHFKIKHQPKEKE